MQAKTPITPQKNEPKKRGRPKLNDLSQGELAKLRMQRMRERKRQQNLVPVEVWIPQEIRDYLVEKGDDLNQAGREAFEALAKKRGY